jgi:hypothetical protein
MKKQQESRIAEEEAIAEERDSAMANLRSLLDRRNHELDSVEQSISTIQEERTRIQLNSNEMIISIFTLRQE